jgi:hypothetical protein
MFNKPSLQTIRGRPLEQPPGLNAPALRPGTIEVLIPKGGKLTIPVRIAVTDPGNPNAKLNENQTFVCFSNALGIGGPGSTGQSIILNDEIATGLLGNTSLFTPVPASDVQAGDIIVFYIITMNGTKVGFHTVPVLKVPRPRARMSGLQLIESGLLDLNNCQSD